MPAIPTARQTTPRQAKQAGTPAKKKARPKDGPPKRRRASGQAGRPAKKRAGKRAVGRRESLHERIWEAVRRIPAGRVATYGQIARLLGLGRSARLVGYALHSLPSGMPVPWHRVINARGTISFPPGSPLFTRQRELLAREGVPLAQGCVDLLRFRWKLRQKDGGQARHKQGRRAHMSRRR